MEPHSIGKMLVLAGALVVFLGLGLMFFDKMPFLGKLPGDITVKRENFQLYFPVATSIVLSLLVSLVLWLIDHFRK